MIFFSSSFTWMMGFRTAAASRRARGVHQRNQLVLERGGIMLSRSKVKRHMLLLETTVLSMGVLLIGHRCIQSDDTLGTGLFGS
jgi:hypothetical protein